MPGLLSRLPFNPVLVNPEDAKSLSVKDVDKVKMESDFGRLEVIINTSDTMEPKVAGIAHGRGDSADKRDIREKGSNVQRIVPDDVCYDWITGLAQMSAVPVNIVRGAQ